MHPVEIFELVIGMLVGIVALHWLADRMKWPPSIALLIGGGALAFVPGAPTFHLDPDLVLVLFLPPLLMDGAWVTDIARFRRHLAGILSLAIGAVIFTTVVVAAVTRTWLMRLAAPRGSLALRSARSSRRRMRFPRAPCLQRIKPLAPPLPRRTLLEEKGLLNDAAGLVLFRFAVAAAMGGAFDPGVAIGRFAYLAIGGVVVGVVVGRLWVALSKRLDDELTLILSLTLVCWLTYLAAEAIHVSGVIATVTVGLVLGWHQHVVLSAAARLRGSSFWSVLVFVLEALVFMLIGLSLREIIEHAGGFGIVFQQLAWPLLAIVLGLTAARFAWVFGSNFLLGIASRAKLTRHQPLDRGSAIVMSWAGMRGVVTLAVALSLPEQMPARDFMLLAAFGVIFVTVVVQGSTLGLVIRASRRSPTNGGRRRSDEHDGRRECRHACSTRRRRTARARQRGNCHPSTAARPIQPPRFGWRELSRHIRSPRECHSRPFRRRHRRGRGRSPRAGPPAPRPPDRR